MDLKLTFEAEMKQKIFYYALNCPELHKIFMDICNNDCSKWYVEFVA